MLGVFLDTMWGRLGAVVVVYLITSAGFACCCWRLTCADWNGCVMLLQSHQVSAVGGQHGEDFSTSGPARGHCAWSALTSSSALFVCVCVCVCLVWVWQCVWVWWCVRMCLVCVVHTSFLHKYVFAKDVCYVSVRCLVWMFDVCVVRTFKKKSMCLQNLCCVWSVCVWCECLMYVCVVHIFFMFAKCVCCV